jgi:hypothetical protein
MMASEETRKPTGFRIEKRKLLLGEGVEEELFFDALLREMQLDDIQVAYYGGKTNLARYLETLRLLPGFGDLDLLIVTRDADSNAAGALASVRSALGKANLGQPDRVGEYGGTEPAIGIWILPDGTNTGMLEDLCLASVTSDTAASCVDEFFNCLDKKGLVPKNMSKARLHAFLSSREKPDLRLGTAAQKGIWDWSSSSFAELKGFLLESRRF